MVKKKLGNKNYSKQHFKKKLNIVKLHKNIFHLWEFTKP